MHRQGFDLQLTQYDERGWRATFYATGMERCPLASGARAAVGLACFPVQALHQRAVAISSASPAAPGDAESLVRNPTWIAMLLHQNLTVGTA
jgi:hypothetical protein